VQSVVFDVTFQLVLEVAVVGNHARLLLHVAGVIVGGVPEFAGTPPASVERFLYLCMVKDRHSMSAVDFQHS